MKTKTALGRVLGLIGDAAAVVFVLIGMLGSLQHGRGSVSIALFVLAVLAFAAGRAVQYLLTSGGDWDWGDPA
jgi:hypothetical protein